MLRKAALIIVDVQGDFLPGGALAVPDGDQVVGPLITAGSAADVVVFTRDFHPPDHISFADDPKFVDKSWPSHCVAGTSGATIHPDLREVFPEAPVFSKGTKQDVEEYSGFAGVSNTDVDLETYLLDQGVTDVWVGGLALDYCVKATALDAIDQWPYDTYVIADATRPVSHTTGVQAVADMADEGVVFITTDDL